MITTADDDILLELFHAGLAAVDPALRLPPALAALPSARGRTLLLGYGKAAAPMAEAAATAAALPAPLEGLIVTPTGYGPERPIAGIEACEGGHPVPDANSEAAARKMLALARSTTSGDRILFLASGGGSACLALPQPPLNLRQKQAIVRHLVLSGAAIAEINTVRKHLSAIKGGRLAAAAGTGAQLTLVISDVVGDDPALVASAPSLPDASDRGAAREILNRVGAPHRDVWEAVLAGSGSKTPTPGSLPGVAEVIARGADALSAAGKAATPAGYRVHDLGDRITGEAREVGAEHARRALALKAQGGRHLLLSGGELTVTVRNPDGRGGPNLEYLAGLALVLNGAAGIRALACDTDGRDGATDVAGGRVEPDFPRRTFELGLDPAALIEANRTLDLFAPLDSLIRTGPTRTNINDFRAILVEAHGDEKEEQR